MATTAPVRAPERQPEPETPTISESPRRLPSPKKPRFTIKVKGMIPT